MENIVILGRQPALGVAELENLYGSTAVKPVGTIAATVSTDVDFARLGGATRLCTVLATLETTNWKEVEKYLIQHLPAHLQDLPEGKVQLGLSAFGVDVRVPQLTASGLTLKKAVRKTGRSVRLVPNNEPELNTAQVLHNHLTGPTGCEVVLVRDGNTTIVAQTTAVQDIASYTLRDRGRPKRDPRVGMLPPKLAQIIINLAGKYLPPGAKVDDDSSHRLNPPQARLLDPFCGTGVLLQEALLLGYSVYGTDIEQRMIDYSRTNLDWANNTFRSTPAPYTVEQGDATTYEWQQPIDLVACETYLGRPFTTPPSAELLAQTVSECNTIIKKFLQNIHKQLQPDTRLCVAVPAWQTKPGAFKHLPLIDSLEEMGYNRVSFEHVREEDLLYYRADQIVARELLVITRK
ncbi:MAG TPA: methyltransferase domain-containing protein [Candidatus Saccharimonadales bacterium]|nr:methyltransferase domain-containing protein [Candidatus Saccharimonadales bacterium]